ncbi:S41 family peptidase [Sulfodiicoccus acidiphilus]|uniref:S41 family peptidase n=1 Tax=Sulfodiicoccus acidiphilus TaxID=1670455 RepID=UPI000F81D967|nr:S41 family peptidase [Sulfodiicoccus acidiphilus]
MLGYYSHPDVHEDEIIFVTEDDLWKVDRRGGKAIRLTSDFGVVMKPRFSPDGEWIAFTRVQVGDQTVSEAYIMKSEGDQPRRLTFFGSPFTEVVGWSREGKVVVSSDFHRPFSRWRELFEIDVKGGDPERLPYGPANSIAWSEKAVVIGRNTIDLPYWKGYRGGTRGMFWIDYYTGRFEKFLNLNGNLNSPIWIRDRFYFLSDHEGRGNLYSVDLRGEDLRKHTDFRKYYARNASSDGRSIVMQVGGDIYLFSEEENLKKIEISAPITRKQRTRKFVEVEKNLGGYAISDIGDTLILTVRGKPFVMRNWDGPAIQIGERDGVRYRLTTFLDRENVITVSDSSGEERIEVHNFRTNSVRKLDLDLGRIEELVPSPTDERVAVSNNRFELWLVDVRTGVTRLLDRSEYGVINDLVWHPEGKFLAYAFPEARQVQSIRLANADTGEVVNVTTPSAKDFSPAFDPEGRYLVYLSKRTLDPSLDQVFFDYSFPKATKPYLVTLRRGADSPFNRQVFSNQEEKEIDLKGIQRRVEVFPIEEGNYAKVEVSKGKVFLLSFPVQGALSSWLWSASSKPNGTIESFDLENLTKEQFLTGVNDFRLSRDGKWILVRAGSQIRVVSTDKKPEQNSSEPGRKSGVIDLSRAKVSVEPELEWRQMLREAWRLMRENFWRDDMGGVDWKEVLEKYEKLLVRINTRYELSDLIKEMQGELGTSHAYEMGGDYDLDRPYLVGGLGADFKFDGQCYRITKIYEGDPSNEGERSPLRAPGVEADEGYCLISIDGVKLTPDIPPQSLLVNRAGDQVVLELQTPEGLRKVSVKTLKDERYLIYRDWVEERRRYVHEKSGGRLGYVHIPDMGPRGFAEFHRLYPLEVQRDGLIVDVRYNGGGHVSHLILEKLSRKRIGVDVPRRGKPVPYPPYSPTRALVAVTNEHAGSDGDIFTHSFKLLGLGPVVGTRTWGGVIGIDPRYRLVDGTIVTQPQFAFWFKDVGWKVENYGTDPTIEVEVTPQDYAKGRDPQLDRAIEEAMKLIELDEEDPLKLVASGR